MRRYAVTFFALAFCSAVLARGTWQRPIATCRLIKSAEWKVLRHPAILAECRGLDRFVRAGLLTESDLRAVIGRAAQAVGKDDEAEIASCVAWGLLHPSAGMALESPCGR